MPELDLSELQHHLLRSGVAPRHVRRTIGELHDHYDDLCEHALTAGSSEIDAHEQAVREIGKLQDIAAAVNAQPELRCWTRRMPYLALLVYPLTCLAVLPAVPIMAGVSHAGDLMRWFACILLGGIVTASLFLVMQLSIALT